MFYLSHKRLCAFWALAWVLSPVGTGQAQTGVSDDRVSLPDGPGSFQGVGDYLNASGHTGAMSFTVPITVPQGFAGMTPSLSIAYSSHAGNGPLGVGWDLAVPSVQRFTGRGLPRYQGSDVFSADSGELVEVQSDRAGRRVYRSRREGSFVRYVRMTSGDYWIAEYPDGSRGYFGADAEGRAVRSARLEEGGHTFRYLLVDRVDAQEHRHRIHYAYRKSSSGEMPRLSRIEYVFVAGKPVYSIRFEYTADRPDAIQDATPGFVATLRHRLTGIHVHHRQSLVRRYALTYESSAGISRLRRVETFGRDTTRYPAVFDFAYSRSIDGACEGTCEPLAIVDMGALPGRSALLNGNATLVDLNGDGIPDLVDASGAGAYQILLGELDANGRAGFVSGGTTSVATRERFPLSEPFVQVLDVDGDGLADLTNASNGRVLCNRGRGDFEAGDCGNLSGLGLILADDPNQTGEADPHNTRFFDLDGDRRIDILKAAAPGAVVGRLNRGDHFEDASLAEPLGRTLDNSAVQFADLNGDGLLDLVEVGPQGVVSGRLHLGFGRWTPTWSPWRSPEVGATERVHLEYQDLNGDGLDDLVLVHNNTLRYALNRGEQRFDATWTSLDASQVPGLPTRTATTVVLFADMNGSGTQDVVWVDGLDGHLRYLDLFERRPNLLVQVDNGVGLVNRIDYTTAAALRASGAEAWDYPFPTAIQVVAHTDVLIRDSADDPRSGQREQTEYRYRHGFYDPREHRFMGFAEVERLTRANRVQDGQDAELIVERYDVGETDSNRAGLLVSRSIFAGVSRVSSTPMKQRWLRYEDCALAGAEPISAQGPRVTFPCMVEQTTVLQEGAAAADWAVLKEATCYDDYGNPTFSGNFGVVGRGAADGAATCACDAGGLAHCTDESPGDELHEAVQYVTPQSPSDPWILGRPHTKERYSDPAKERTQEHYYYDGERFLGMPLGRLLRGNLTRVTALKRAGAPPIAQLRNAYDAHGNVVIALGPLGAPDDANRHRRRYRYDARGLRVRATEIALTSPEGTPYALRRETDYDDDFGQVASATGWMIAGGPVSSTRNETQYRYDAFGRLHHIARPGDTFERPSKSIAYQLGSPFSRVITRRTASANETLVQVACYDGLGRVTQTRTQVDGDTWLVTGYAVFNRRGATVRTLEPFTARSGFCTDTGGATPRAVERRYDALGREVERILPDADIYGEPSRQQTRFLPLLRASFDSEDLDATSPHFDTPTLVRTDGLGRIVAVERRLSADGQTEATRAEFDSLGRLAAVIDAAGHRKVQRWDLLGRVVEVDDPNAGRSGFEYDDAGMLLARTDARGVVARSAYDGANRVVAQWDEADPAGTRVTFRYDFGGACDPTTCTNAEGQAIEIRYPMLGAVTDRLGGPGYGLDHFGFDPRGRRTYQSRTVAGLPLVTRHEFDGADREVATVYPDGRRISRRFDRGSRLRSIEGVLESLSYDGRGLPYQATYVNRARETWTHDGRGRLVASSIAAADERAIRARTYDRDRVGNIVRLTDTAPAAGRSEPADARHSYDGWYRVTQSAFETSDAVAHTKRFEYDRLDNLLSVASDQNPNLDPPEPGDAAAMAYAPTRPNAVVRIGLTPQTYDDAGHMTERGDTVLDWDFLGRLRHASRGNRKLAEFGYGAGTSRVATVEGGSVTIYASANYELRDGIGVLYARLGRTRIARLESASLATSALADVAPVGAPDGRITAADAFVQSSMIAARAEAGRRDTTLLLRSAARRLLLESGDDFAILHSDHIGSLGVATDASGHERGRRAFRWVDGSDRHRTFVDHYGFNGQEEFVKLGLIRFRHRWLDVGSARWTRPDPSFLTVSGLTAVRAGEAANPYAYVGNNFINSRDPDGLRRSITNIGRFYTASENRAARMAAHVPEWVRRVFGVHTAQDNDRIAFNDIVRRRLSERDGQGGYRRDAQGFSGAIDSDGAFLLRPSADPNQEPMPDGFVRRNGGHIALLQEGGADVYQVRGGNVTGFTLIMTRDGNGGYNAELQFLSRGLNVASHGYADVAGTVAAETINNVVGTYLGIANITVGMEVDTP